MKAELGLLSAHVGKRIPGLSSRDFSVIAAVARFSASAFKLYLAVYLFLFLFSPSLTFLFFCTIYKIN